MLEKFERYPLTFSPTPIERLKRLSAHLGDKVDLYAKREDSLRASHSAAKICASSNTLSVMHRLKRRHAGVDRRRQSNHTRQVAAVEARAQMLRRKRKRKQSERPQPLSSAKRVPECD
jgi:1-aminocyclopropane-1-carboxylate deaminase